jgi:hypothetical protein
MAAAALCSAALVAEDAHAAQITDVADAADGDDPFDANLELNLEYTFHRAIITRENTQRSTLDNQVRTVRVRELDYMRHRVRLKPRVEVGVFHDLSVFAEWPILLWDQRNLAFSANTTVNNSTIGRDMTKAPVVDAWDDPGPQYGIPGVQRQQEHNAWGFNLDQNGSFQKIRSGLDYPIVGGRWSPVNNERDPTKPTITLQFDYKVAFIPLPVAQADGEPPATEVSLFAADATHRFHGVFAISKRFLLLDPYFQADYTFPLAASTAVLGLEPRHDGGFLLGMEIVPYENADLDQKFAVDLSFGARYFSPGRDYSEMSDALGELTLTDEFFRTSLAGKLYFRAWKFIYLDLTGEMLYDTPHYLTTEQIGCDGGCPDAGLIPRIINGLDGTLVRDGQVSLDRADGERNPYFNPVYDTVGRRFRVEESIRFRILGHVALTF